MAKSRRVVTVLSLAGAFALVMASHAFAAPPHNDDFNRPKKIGHIPRTVHEDTSEATIQSGEPTTSVCELGAQEYGATVWFTFKPHLSMTVEADTAGSTYPPGADPPLYDTVLTVWTFDGTTFTEVTCNDDASPQIDPNNEFASHVTFSAAADTTYYFQVGTCCGSGASNPIGTQLVFNIYP